MNFMLALPPAPCTDLVQQSQQLQIIPQMDLEALNNDVLPYLALEDSQIDVEYLKLLFLLMLSVSRKKKKLCITQEADQQFEALDAAHQILALPPTQQLLAICSAIDLLALPPKPENVNLPIIQDEIIALPGISQLPQAPQMGCKSLKDTMTMKELIEMILEKCQANILSQKKYFFNFKTYTQYSEKFGDTVKNYLLEKIIDNIDEVSKKLFEGIVPEEFLCPITHQLFEDPVINSIGQTYERSALKIWAETSQNLLKDPLTNVEIKNVIYPNKIIYKLVYICKEMFLNSILGDN